MSDQKFNLHYYLLEGNQKIQKDNYMLKPVISLVFNSRQGHNTSRVKTFPSFLDSSEMLDSWFEKN